MLDYTQFRGFNYQPGYAVTTFESWRHFDKKIWELELRRGKALFPGINAIRLWLDWGAYIADPAAFVHHFTEAVDLVDRICGARTVACLFNRWHNSWLDAGGIYIDHFMPKWSWIDAGENRFLPYLRDIVGSFKDDPRIAVWDCCNEPFSYNQAPELMPEVAEGEYLWLKSMVEKVKDLGACQAVGISIHPGHGRKGLEQVEPLEDILLIHPYYTDKTHNPSYTTQWRCLLDDYQAVSRISGKPLLITECCWGDVDDAARAEFVATELAEFSSRGIGYLAHALHHSLLADLHDPADGPTGGPGNLMFINPDGTLRAGHDNYNQF